MTGGALQYIYIYIYIYIERERERERYYNYIIHTGKPASCSSTMTDLQSTPPSREGRRKISRVDRIYSGCPAGEKRWDAPLYYTILCYTIMYCTAMYCTLYYIILYYFILYYNIKQDNTRPYNILQCSGAAGSCWWRRARPGRCTPPPNVLVSWLSHNNSEFRGVVFEDVVCVVICYFTSLNSRNNLT